MSMKDQWLDRCDFIRRTASGIDSTTHQLTFAVVPVLSNEPCDLSQRPRRVAQQGPSGTVYNQVRTPVLKVWPENIAYAPDANDEIVVNGTRYRVVDRQDYFDAATKTYRGSRLDLTQIEITDAQTVDPPAHPPQPFPLP